MPGTTVGGGAACNGGVQQLLALPPDVRRVLAIPEAAETLDSDPGDFTASACFEMHAQSVVIRIQVSVDLRTNNPYKVLGGSISGDLIGPIPRPWTVTGSFGEVLTLGGEVGPVVVEDPQANAPQAEAIDAGLKSVTIIGFLHPPDAYPGAWGTDGLFDPLSPAFYCTTLFKGWQVCP